MYPVGNDLYLRRRWVQSAAEATRSRMNMCGVGLVVLLTDPGSECACLFDRKRVLATE